MTLNCSGSRFLCHYISASFKASIHGVKTFTHQSMQEECNVFCQTLQTIKNTFTQSDDFIWKLLSGALYKKKSIRTSLRNKFSLQRTSIVFTKQSASTYVSPANFVFRQLKKYCLNIPAAQNSLQRNSLSLHNTISQYTYHQVLSGLLTVLQSMCFHLVVLTSVISGFLQPRAYFFSSFILFRALPAWNHSICPSFSECFSWILSVEPSLCFISQVTICRQKRILSDYKHKFKTYFHSLEEQSCINRVPLKPK